jgi:glycosyltransferase involved in cell wall biosynthesis
MAESGFLRNRVVFIMPRFRHDDVRVSHKEAWSLAQVGFDVTLVCKAAPVTSYLGMHVVAAHTLTQNAVFRAFANLPRLVAQALELDADIYVLENPDTLFLGFVLVALRKRVVYSTHEDFAAKMELRDEIPRWLRGFAGRAVRVLERTLAHLCDGTVVTQIGLVEKYGRKAILVENAPLTRGPVVEQAREHYAELTPQHYPSLVYSGGLTLDRGLMRMLDLLLELRRGRNWRLKLVGWFHPANLESLARRHPAWPHVDYTGHVSHALSLAHIRAATFGLVLLDDIADYRYTSPNKLYEYMALETPFVASDFINWRRSVDGTQAGLFVDQLDTDGIALQIAELVEDNERLRAMAVAGKQFINDRFNWGNVGRPMETLIIELAQNASSAVFYADESARRS